MNKKILSEIWTQFSVLPFSIRVEMLFFESKSNLTLTLQFSKTFPVSAFTHTVYTCRPCVYRHREKKTDNERETEKERRRQWGTLVSCVKTIDYWHCCCINFNICWLPELQLALIVSSCMPQTLKQHALKKPTSFPWQLEPTRRGTLHFLFPLSCGQQQSNGSLYLVVVDAKQINKMLVDILWQPMKQTAVRICLSPCLPVSRSNRLSVCQPGSLVVGCPAVHRSVCQLVHWPVAK